jgi:RND family efflux transporter MFP subunit
MERTLDVTGSLAADETVNASAETAGTLIRVAADFGQAVRKGDVLAEIDSRETSLQVERTRAALTQALARVGLSPGQEDGNPSDTPAIRQAMAQMEDARSRYESAAKLVESGDVSRERNTELEKAYRAREAAVQAARDDLRMQLALIQSLRAEWKLAQKRLGDTLVRAPFDGVVTAKLISAGQYIKENVPILTLVKSGPLRLRADIPEVSAAHVRAGTALTFTTGAVPGATFRAVVRELNPSLDPRSRSLTAEARLVAGGSPAALLKPGMFVEVRLMTGGASVVAAPREALYTVAGMTKIFLVNGETAAGKQVQPGREENGWVEIPGGIIKPGDKLAAGNLAALVDGTRVRLTGPARESRP